MAAMPVARLTLLFIYAFRAAGLQESLTVQDYAPADLPDAVGGAGAAVLLRDSSELGQDSTPVDLLGAPGVAKVASLLRSSQEPEEAQESAPVGLPDAGGLARATGQLRSSKEPGADAPDAAPSQIGDGVPDSYWQKIDMEIGLAEAKQGTGGAAAMPTEQGPWKKILTSAPTYQGMDTPEKLQQGSLMSKMGHDTTGLKRMPVLPYDMQFGARIMNELSETKPQTPPPTQASVNEVMLAQCPMVVFGDALRIQAPRCGSSHGQWKDPQTERAVMRWIDNHKGGVDLRVDSSVSGAASVLFAEFRRRFTFSKYEFQLANCLGLPRYLIEESIIRVNSMAAGAKSTAHGQDLSKSGVAYFYKYTIRSPSGADIAETTLFRMNSGQVNLTRMRGDDSEGETIAIARRLGDWSADQWKDCTEQPHEWSITYPQSNASDVLATAQDLRVASAAVITLMAWRQENVGENGVSSKGLAHLYWSMGQAVLVIVVLIIVVCFCWGLSMVQASYDYSATRGCLRLESMLMPKKPMVVRKSVLHATH